MATIYQVCFRYNYSGVGNEFTRLFEGPDGYLDSGNFLEYMGALIENNFPAGGVPNNFEFRNIYMNDLLNTGPGITHVPSTWPHAGTSSLQTLGPSAVVNVTLRATGTQYPVRGTIQFPFVFESWQSSGRISDAAQIVIYNMVVGGIVNALYPTTSTDYRPKLYAPSTGISREIESASVSSIFTTNKRKRKGALH